MAGLPSIPTITNPVGIDKKIKELQDHLNENLASSNFYSTNYKCYGRAYLNRKDDGVIPQIYLGSKEYVDIRIDDRETAFSFFLVEGNVDGEENFVATIRLITYINLGLAYSSIAHRADEEAHRDMYRHVLNFGRGWDYTGMTWGIENVYEGIDISPRMYDMQPYHVFSLNLEIPFSYEFGNCNNF